MSNKIVRLALAIGLSIIFCFESGCSSIRPAAPMSPEQTAKLQERLGNIGVVSVHYTPRVELQTPGKGRLANAERGAADLSRMTLGAGALVADSPSAVANKEAALLNALSKMRVQETMRDRFMENTSTVSGYHFRTLDGQGALTEADRPDYRSLKISGIDTIQELAVREFGLSAENHLDPDLLFYMQLQARLVDTANNHPIIIRTFSCESGRHKFIYWTDSEAQKFREEIDRCYDDLAYQLTADCYLYDTVTSGFTGREKLLTGRPR